MMPRGEARLARLHALAGVLVAARQQPALPEATSAWLASLIEELGSGAADADVLLRVAEPLGLRVSQAHQTVALALARPPLGAVLLRTAHAALLVERRAGTLKVWGLDGDAPPEEATPLLLARRLSAPGAASALPENLVVEVIVFEEALPFSELSTASAAREHYGHSDGHSDGHGHEAHAHPWRRVLALLALERRDVAMVALYALFVGGLALATPLAVQTLVGTVAFGTLLQPLIVLSILLVAALAFAGVLRTAQLVVVELLQRRIFVRLVSDLAYRLPRVTREAVEGHDGSKLVNRFFDVVTVQKASATLLLEGIVVALELVAGTALLAAYSPWLLMFSLFLIAAVFVVVFPLGIGATRSAVAESWAKHAVADWLEDVARNVETFGGAAARGAALVRADALTRAYLHARGTHFGVVLRQAIGAFVVQAAGAALLLGFGGWLVINGRLSLGQLVAAELIVSAIAASLMKLSKQLEAAYDLAAGVEKLGHLVDLPVERGAGGTPPPRAGAPALLLEAVAVPAAAERPITLSISRGEQVALVAAPGTAVRPLFDVIRATRPCTSGVVHVGGWPVAELALGALRDRVVLIGPHAELFDGSIADNVRAGRVGARPAALAEAIARAGLEPFVRALPEGTATRVGHGGIVLSRSEAMRLMFARAFFAEPDVLCIDGAFDTETEAERLPLLKAVCESGAPWAALVASADPRVWARCTRAVSLESHGDVEEAR